MANILIGLSGHLGSGKDTVAELLIKNYTPMKYECKHIKFATKVKEISAMLTNTGKTYEESLADNLSAEGKAKFIPELGMSLGKIQQQIGEGLRNLIHPDVWVHALLSNVKSDTEDSKTITIISDVRYPNEVVAIHKRGGIVIRINRKDIPEKCIAGRDTNHPSETSLDDCKDFDIILDNGGSKEDLEILLMADLNQRII